MLQADASAAAQALRHRVSEAEANARRLQDELDAKARKLAETQDAVHQAQLNANSCMHTHACTHMHAHAHTHACSHMRFIYPANSLYTCLQLAQTEDVVSTIYVSSTCCICSQTMRSTTHCNRHSTVRRTSPARSLSCAQLALSTRMACAGTIDTLFAYQSVAVRLKQGNY